MLEPTFLSVAELADRWKQTERQILERGALSRLPLYFLFDGLMFDSGDQWLKSNGVEYTGAQAEYERLRDTVNTWEAVLKRHAAVRRGQIKPSEYEDLPLQPEAVKQYRDEIDTATKRIDELDRCLEQRERERRQSAYYGYLRALPGAIGDILQGKPVAVMYAHHPERGMVAVEGRPVTLTPADLLASMAEVKAIEGEVVEPHSLPTPKRTEARKDAILDGLRALGYNPAKLPKRESGKSWVKAHFWKEYGAKGLFTGESAFNKAWDSLRATGEIAEEE